MAYLDNPYEAEFMRKDRTKQIAHQVKQFRGPAQTPGKARAVWLSAMTAFSALLYLIIAQ